MEVSQNRGTLFGGLYNKDHSILGSILGFPFFGKLPYQSAEVKVIVVPQAGAAKGQ